MSSDSVYAREATFSSDDESEDTSSSIINRPTSRAGSLASGRGSRSRSRKKRVGQYIIGETIGKGSFGTVKVGTHCDTGERVALKFLSKKQVRDISEVERLFRESAILTSLKCEHIIRLYEVIDDVAHIVMVMELAQGGELLDVIKARHALPEREACKVFSEIVAGVEYCHRKNVIHRDLKLENILMVNQTVKIADFGLSNTAILGRSELGTACGTPSYLAPEQINRETGQHIGAPADLWSMGVILYAMVAGFLPFQARSTPALFKKILNLEFTYPDYFSEELRDLIGRMLTPDPESRATISEVKSHPWYMMELSDLADASTRQVSEDAVKQAREKVSEKAAQAKASTRTKAPAASKPKLKRADSAKLPPLPSVPTTTTSTSIAKRDTAPSPTSRSMRGSGGSVSSVRSGASATGQFKLRQQQQQGSGASSRASSIDSTASVKSSPTPSWKSSSLTPSSRLPDFEFDDDDEAPSGTSSGNNNNNNNAILLPSVAETVRTRSRLHSTGHSGKHLTSDSDLPSTLSTK